MRRFTERDPNRSGAYSVTCSECREFSTLPANNSSGTFPPEVVKKKFASRGWHIGNKPSKDVCPKCLNRRSEVIYQVDKNLRVETDMKHGHLTVVPKEEEAVTVENGCMEREHRRIILAKLNEVYQDEAQGYIQGWSDKRVATDLGVLEWWVKDLRQENFGDLAVSASDTLAVEEGRRILKEVLLTTQELARVRQELESLEAKMEGLVEASKRLAETIAKVAA